MTKQKEKNFDGNYTKMLRAILNESLNQHPTKQQLYGNLPPISKTIEIRRTKHTGHCERSKDEDIIKDLQWTPSHRRQVLDDPQKLIFNSSVRTQDVI